MKIDCHCFNLRRSVNFVTNLYNKHMEASGITANQFSILGALNRLGSSNVSGLANELGLERTTVVRALKPLFKMGLIEDKSLEGRRGKMLTLTKEGLAKLEYTAVLWREAQADLENRLGKERLEKLYEIMSVMQKD